MVDADQLLFVDVHGRQQETGPGAVEIGRVFYADQGHFIADVAKLGAVALEFAFGEELFVDNHGERSAIDLLLVGEIFELGQERSLPGVVGRMGEDEHGGV